jgi:hypothetical protein
MLLLKCGHHRGRVVEARRAMAPVWWQMPSQSAYVMMTVTADRDAQHPTLRGMPTLVEVALGLGHVN